MADLREDLLDQAVRFLADPKAAESPLAQRLQFLESKGLTELEIAEALKRASKPSSSSSSSPSQSSQATAYAPPRPAYLPGQAYQPAPPPLPQRDWKDIFVMATASVGVSYGLYVLAKRYVLPLITPPTPAALEADKEAITAEFDRTDKLIQQIQADTEALKEAEQKRLDALDAAVEELHKVMDEAKSQLSARETEMRQLQTDIETVKTDLPKYLERVNDSQRRDLLEIQTELKSLKQIVSNRVKSSVSSPQPPPPTSTYSSGTSTPVEPTANGSTSSLSSPHIPPSSLKPPSRSGIPAWQLAAAKRSSPSPDSAAKPDESTTTTEVSASTS
ncbi:microbody biogenesis protein peroxin 14 [Myxozyma melibiosi]|uniref:Peroxisomal membrane protein PEX14 n=1 Tax=Myxozyma melibiosi TaxID=54550 RepID=A0ABR1F465_9ASCO